MRQDIVRVGRMRLSGMDGFDSRFSVMDEEPGRISHIYSVTLSGDGIGDACYCSLQLKIKVG